MAKSENMHAQVCRPTQIFTEIKTTCAPEFVHNSTEIYTRRGSGNFVGFRPKDSTIGNARAERFRRAAEVG